MENLEIEEKEIKIFINIIKKIHNPKYRETLKRFIIEKVKDGKRVKTIESYLLDLKQFFKYLDLKEKEINKLQELDIERYKKYLLKNNLKAKTINRKLTSINQLLKYVGCQVRYKKVKEQKQNILNDVLTKEEIEKMIRFCGENIRDKAIIMTLYKTGLRVSELLKLTTQDVNKNTIEIEGKGGKYRGIPVVEGLRIVWKEYLKVRKPIQGNQLFTGKHGALQRYSINNIIIKYAKKAKISKQKAHPHNFRHAFCKMLADKGVSINIIADLAGHESLETTRIYTRQSKKELMNIIESI